MKKLFSIFAIAVLIFTFGVSVCAQEETTGTDVSEEINIESAEAVTEAPQPDSGVNYDEYAKQIVEYIFSGEESPAQIMDKLSEIIDQYRQAKENGYTFKERMSQLITPENIITTVAACFLLICGVAFFVMEQKRKNDRYRIYGYVSDLEKKYSDEVESNKKLRTQVENQTAEISEMKSILTEISEKSTVTKKDMEQVSNSAVAVCNMVKDVFLNSKTLSADAKELMIHNYLKAFDSGKGTEEAKNEQQA